MVATIAVGTIVVVVAAVVGDGWYCSKPASDQDDGENSFCIHFFISRALSLGSQLRPIFPRRKLEAGRPPG
jgi:hypothetical protein